MAEQIHVGVMRLVLTVGGARTLKDRRQAVRSVVERLRHKLQVTCHEVGGDQHPGQQVVVVTTAGNDARLIRTIFDKVQRMVESHGAVWPGAVDVDVFRWHPSGRDYSSFVDPGE